jgi:protein HIRA/HIR1
MSDVNSVAWSSDDDYLATAGLDKVIIIWDGHSFGEKAGEKKKTYFPISGLIITLRVDMIAKLDNHTGFVKGISWDPAGEFLASQASHDTFFFHTISNSRST